MATTCLVGGANALSTGVAYVWHAVTGAWARASVPKRVVGIAQYLCGPAGECWALGGGVRGRFGYSLLLKSTDYGRRWFVVHPTNDNFSLSPNWCWVPATCLVTNDVGRTLLVHL